MSVIGHSLGSVIMYDLLLHTAECMGVDVTTDESPTLSPTLSSQTSASSKHGGSPRAVQLANKKGSEDVVRFDPSVMSLESGLQSLQEGEDEPGRPCKISDCVCV